MTPSPRASWLSRPGLRARGGRSLALAILLGWASPSALAGAPDADDFRYTVVAGDTLYDIAQRMLQDPTQWKALKARNRIAEPRRLQPGQAIVFPTAWLRREDLRATVIGVEGETRAERGGQPVPLEVGATLAADTRITTGVGGAVVLVLADGTTLRLQAATDLELQRVQRVLQSSTYDDRLLLRKGRVAVGAAPREGPAARLEVLTPRAVAGVRGTEFRVGASPGASLLEVLDGTVSSRGAAADSAPLGVAAGEGVVYDAATVGSPRIVRLLPAVQVEPVAATQNETSVTIDFAPAPGAAGYRVQVARDANFHQVIDERVVAAPPFRTGEIADGRYWIRVRAIDGSGLEGHDAAVDFSVLARPRPPFALIPAGHGKERGAAVGFAWTGAPGAAAYRLQIARDPAMQSMLRDEGPLAATGLTIELPLVDADYHWRLASIDAGGKQGPWSQVMPLERRLQAEQLAAPATDDMDLVLRWSGAEGVDYQVAMAGDEAFATEVTRFAAHGPSLRIPKPAPGTHFLRVRATDHAGNAGPWSDAQRIEIPYDYTPLLILLLVPLLLL